MEPGIDAADQGADRGDGLRVVEGHSSG